MKSKRQLKKERLEKRCYSKRAYKSAKAAREADSREGIRPYCCRTCFYWHNTSSPDMDEVDAILREANR